MSRNYRGRVFTPRWGHTVLRERQKFTKKEVLAYLDRMLKRMAGAQKQTKNPMRYWHYEDMNVTVVARTKSEARARMKQAMNQKLPKGITITKGEIYEEA